MILEIIPDGGIGRATPLVIRAAQVVVRQDNGTPIMVAGHYGPDRTYAVASAAHDVDDFNDTMRKLGVGMTVVLNHVTLPKPPPGARLVAGPPGNKRSP